MANTTTNNGTPLETVTCPNCNCEQRFMFGDYATYRRDGEVVIAEISTFGHSVVARGDTIADAFAQLAETIQRTADSNSND